MRTQVTGEVTGREQPRGARPRIFRSPLRPRQAHCAGQALVEFALVAPIFFLMLIAIFSFGMLFGWKHVLNNAARDAARLGAVGKQDDQIRAIISSRTAMLPRSDTVRVAMAAQAADGTPLGKGQREKGGAFTVTLTYPAEIIGIPGILGGTKDLTAQATFRMERGSSATP